MLAPLVGVLVDRGTDPSEVTRRGPLLVFNGGPYVAAVHANGSPVGPTTLYPGATPAKPGEVVVLYAKEELKRDSCTADGGSVRKVTCRLPIATGRPAKAPLPLIELEPPPLLKLVPPPTPPIITCAQTHAGMQNVTTMRIALIPPPFPQSR
jgi:hypothetical protein